MQYTQQRNRDFVARCRRIIAESRAAGTPLGVRQAVMRAIYAGAPSFYIGFDSAYGRVLDVLRTPPDQRLRDTARRQRMTVLAERIEKRLARNPLMRYATALTIELTSTRAPRFYITPVYGMRILRDACRNDNVRPARKGVRPCV